MKKTLFIKGCILLTSAIVFLKVITILPGLSNLLTAPRHLVFIQGGALLAFIPFQVGLLQVWKLIKCLEAFPGQTRECIQHIRNIKYCAGTILGLYSTLLIVLTVYHGYDTAYTTAAAGHIFKFWLGFVLSGALEDYLQKIHDTKQSTPY